ncbi:MAG TPA: ACP S-malonyltransferase [Microbacteriaceae bacterium]|nr:ACP S-malonyltransferase [Microbacteriaceae bacterium]
MIVVACPGQGSQKAGFLAPWLGETRFAWHLAAISEACGIDLAMHGTMSDNATITETSLAQPLIVAAGLLVLGELLADGRRAKIGGVAGHSVGEITAAAAAGILTEDDAVSFVRERGLAMAEAAGHDETGMSAVLGADETELERLLAQFGLAPANYNGGGQIVVAGPVKALAELKENPPAHARVIPLRVAGAFHTRFMLPAVQRLTAYAATLPAADPQMRVWSNRDGQTVGDGRRFVDLMIGQVSSPVRWDRCMKSFVAAGITGLIEVCPAGALVGLAKRGLPGIPTVAVKTPDDLPAAIELIDRDS